MSHTLATSILVELRVRMSLGYIRRGQVFLSQTAPHRWVDMNALVSAHSTATLHSGSVSYVPVPFGGVNVVLL